MRDDKAAKAVVSAVRGMAESGIIKFRLNDIDDAEIEWSPVSRAVVMLSLIEADPQLVEQWLDDLLYAGTGGVGGLAKLLECHPDYSKALAEFNGDESAFSSDADEHRCFDDAERARDINGV